MLATSKVKTWKVGEWKSPDKWELPSPLRLSSQATLSIFIMMMMTLYDYDVLCGVTMMFLTMMRMMVVLI